MWITNWLVCAETNKYVVEEQKEEEEKAEVKGELNR